MRRQNLFSLVLAIAVLGSTPAPAQTGFLPSANTSDQWAGLTPNEQAMVDRIAADFYESDLRLAQSRQIEASTSAIYASLTDEERWRFREERRNAWKSMNEGERAALRSVKLPAYSNLTDAQKAPFRQIAIDRLAPRPSPTSVSPAATGPGGDI